MTGENGVKTMARERMVTRTIENAELSVLRVNTKTRETAVEVLTISATIPENKALKIVHKAYDNGEWKSVDIIERKVTETLYGMSEQEFIKLARVLPPRTAKADDGE